jgi:hypothetical protein
MKAERLSVDQTAQITGLLQQQTEKSYTCVLRSQLLLVQFAEVALAALAENYFFARNLFEERL